MHALARHWPVAALAAGGWFVLARSAAASSFTGPLCTAGGGFGALHVSATASAASASAQSILVHAGAMAATMLFPFVIEPLAHVSRSSFRSARPVQMILFTIAVGLVWTAFGIVAALIGIAAVVAGAELLVGGAALAIASAWQWGLPKRLALARCHASPPVYGGGLAGFRSSASFGRLFGGACVASCGPVMLAAMLSPMPVPAMAVAAWLSARERYGPAAAVGQHGRLLAAAAAATFAVAAGAAGS